MVNLLPRPKVLAIVPPPVRLNVLPKPSTCRQKLSYLSCLIRGSLPPEVRKAEKDLGDILIKQRIDLDAQMLSPAVDIVYSGVFTSANGRRYDGIRLATSTPDVNCNVTNEELIFAFSDLLRKKPELAAQAVHRADTAFDHLFKKGYDLAPLLSYFYLLFTVQEVGGFLSQPDKLMWLANLVRGKIADYEEYPRGLTREMSEFVRLAEDSRRPGSFEESLFLEAWYFADYFSASKYYLKRNRYTRDLEG